NVVIACELGVSRERVRQVRREVGVKPERSAAERFAQFVALRQEQMQGLTVMQAVRASGLSLCYEIARDVLRGAGISPFRRKHKEFDFNWKLPNRDLAVAHGLSIQQVANLRFRLNSGPAQWDVRGGRVLTDADYLSARDAEARKVQGAAGKPKPMRRQRLASTARSASGTNGHSFSHHDALKKMTRRSR
ncbi:MAG: hypothetical protein ACREJM_11970, partial [Candidatus Saccharimonadales bacterium]